MTNSEDIFREVEQIEAARDAAAPGDEAGGGIYEEIPFGVWMANPDGGLRYASTNFLDLLGMTMEEARGFGWTARVAPEDAGSVERWKRCLAEQRDWDDEHRILTRAGEARTLLARGHAVRDESGGVACWIGVHLDITERKRAEQLVRDARDFAEALVVAAPAPLLVLDGRQRVVTANPAFYRTFGTGPDRTVGAPLHELGDGQWDIPELRRLLESILNTSAAVDDYEVEHDFPGIGRKVMLVNGRRVLQRGGRDELVLLVIRDVTGRKALEDELRVIQETEAVQRERQRMAHRLHDEMQQLLIAAKMRVDMLRRAPQHAEDAALLAQVGEILVESVAAARDLAVELAPPSLFDAGLAGAAEWLAGWMRDKHGLELEAEVSPEVSRADPAVCLLLFETIRELLLNVVKHAGVKRATLRLDMTDGGQMQVVVGDEGVGFDGSGTRPGGVSATGLGLPSLRRRIGALGGTFDVRSGPGGTTVTVRVPQRRVG